jgi:tetratricopeptide (TPR) repeat protein
LAAAALVTIAIAIPAWLRSGDGQGPATTTAAQDRARAVEAYERAKFLLGRRSPGDVELAEKYFEQATEYDPGYALAWSGLASARWIATIEGRVPRAQGMARLRDAAERALAIDPTLAEPHLRLANYRWVAGDSAAARAHVQRAMELEPRNPLVLGFAASRAADDGRLDEAIGLQRRAVEVEPLVGVARYNLATMLYAAGDLDAAESELRRLLEISPGTPGAGGLLAVLLVRQGRHDDALDLVSDDPYGIDGLQVQALVHYASGRTAEADAALRALIEVCPQDERYRVAEVYAYRGELEQAFAWLEPESSSSSRNPAWYKSRSPFLQPLHADPRWQAWLDAS